MNRALLYTVVLVFLLTFSRDCMAFKTEVVKEASIALEHYIPDKVLKDKSLLFIHGSGGGSWGWKNFLSYFAQRGYDSWALNLRGHYIAGPVKDWGEVGLAEYLEDIDCAVKKVGENVVLIGHSMSSLPIVKYGESHQLAGLIVSHPGPPKYLQQKRGIKMQRPQYKQVIRDNQVVLPTKDREVVKRVLFDRDNVDEEKVSFYLDNLGEESVRAIQEITNIVLDQAKITAPVYVLGFDTSKIGINAQVDICKVVAEEIGAKDYVVIEPGGHCYMHERNWQEFAKQFEAWINAK